MREMLRASKDLHNYDINEKKKITSRKNKYTISDTYGLHVEGQLNGVKEKKRKEKEKKRKPLKRMEIPHTPIN